MCLYVVLCESFCKDEVDPDGWMCELSVPPGRKHDNPRTTSECSPAETQYGKCVPEEGDCGEGLREATCQDRTDKLRCKIPCNWKKDIRKTPKHKLTD